MAPHSGSGGCAPRPRKPRPAAVRMMPAMSRVTRTISEERQSGTTWREDDARRRGALQLHGGDEVGVADRQRLGARDAGIGRPGRDGDGDDGVLDAGPKRGDEGQRQDQPREGEEDVGDAHQHRVDPAAEIAGDGADEEADRRGDDGHQHDDQRVMREP